ncbi:MAG: dTDP-4-dehydrorhamnose 3,5-epimerase [Pseudomonadota bacterium]|jgi:dTDP-4-dehydrorhamnose 3,5-epimerase
MNPMATRFADVVLFQPRKFADERGSFYESFNNRAFHAAIGKPEGYYHFVQDNHSTSKLGVVRGLHYQIEQAQGKLVRVVSGEVVDVVVDMRRSSVSFGQHEMYTLSAINGRMLWVPPGFAHGFMALSDKVEFLYKTTDFWAPQHERTLLWNDPALNIAWPNTHTPIVNDKDKAGQLLVQADTYL